MSGHPVVVRRRGPRTQRPCGRASRHPSALVVPMSASRQTVRVIYRGRVQGVGFRWTTCGIARRFAVDGSVRNLADGTVEMIAQGEPREVAAFREAIDDAMRELIDGQDVSAVDSPEQLSGFHIRH